GPPRWEAQRQHRARAGSQRLRMKPRIFSRPGTDMDTGIARITEATDTAAIIAGRTTVTATAATIAGRITVTGTAATIAGRTTGMDIVTDRTVCIEPTVPDKGPAQYIPHARTRGFSFAAIRQITT